MAGTNLGARFANGVEPFGGGALDVEVVAEDRQAVIVEARGEVGDVTADHQGLADPYRLVARGEEELDRAVAENVVVAVDQDEAIRVDAPLVAGQEEGAGDRLGILGRLPFAALHVDRQ